MFATITVCAYLLTDFEFVDWQTLQKLCVSNAQLLPSQNLKTRRQSESETESEAKSSWVSLLLSISITNYLITHDWLLLLDFESQLTHSVTDWLTLLVWLWIW